MHRLWSIALGVIPVAVTALTADLSCGQTRLPEVTVTAPEERGAAGALELGRPSEVGSRLGLTLQELPASVDILPGSMIRERGDTTAQEAVTRATGITAAGTPGDGSSALASRGFVGHSSVMQLYDGTRLYVGAGTMTFPTDTWLLDRIEVMRGPASVLFGEGAVGGAINYVPRRPLRTERVTDAILSGGSYDTFQAGVNSSGPISNRAAYQVGVIGTTSDGYVDNGDLQRLSLASSLLFDVTPDVTLRLAFDGQLNDPSRYWGTPLNDGSIDERLRKRNYNVRNSAIYYEDAWIRAAADWRITPSVTLRNETYALIADRHWRNLENYEFLPATSEVLRTGYLEIYHDQQQYGNRLDTRLIGSVWGRPYRVVAGFDVNYIDFKMTNNSPFEGESIVDAFSPEPGLFQNVAGTRPRFDTDTTQFALFTEGLIRVIGRFNLLAGLRYDHIDFNRDDLVNPANSFGTTFNPVTWRVGGVYDITQMIAAYAQITNGVDPLGSLITLPLSQRNAKLTSAMQYEIGLKSQFLGGRAQTTLALYYLTKENLLSVNPTDPTIVQQVGKQSAYGIEVAAGLQLTSYLALNANAALLNARFDDFQESDGDVTVSRDGKQPPDVPEQMANLWAVVTPAVDVAPRRGRTLCRQTLCRQREYRP